MTFPVWRVSHLTKAEHTGDLLHVSVTSKWNQRTGQSIDLKIWTRPDPNACGTRRQSQLEIMTALTQQCCHLCFYMFIYITVHWQMSKVNCWGGGAGNCGQFPWGQISVPGWWIPEHFRGILHLANHRAQVPFTQIPSAPLWTPTCCWSYPSATATMLFKKINK